MVKALKRAAKVSATISVPSSVMTMPLGNHRSSAATLAWPSGSIRTSAAGAGSPPPMRSKPKLPAYAKPCRSTIRSFRCPLVSAETSAYSETVPSDDLARAAAQRGHAWRQARVPGVGGAVEGRAGGAPAQDGQARRRRALARVRPRPPRRQGPVAGRDRGGRSGGQGVEGPQQAASSGPTVGDRVHLPPLPGRDGPRVKNGPAVTGAGAEAVRDAIAAELGGLPEHLRRSLTWDQGAELAQHARLKIDLGLQVYFCDPQSPWQRGTNENTNGLLRQYFPKGTDLARHSPDDLAAVADALNSRPRKTLGWRTPAEVLDESLAAAA